MPNTKSSAEVARQAVTVARTKLGAECVKQAKTKWGEGWRLLSDQQQRDAVCGQIVNVMFAQDDLAAASHPASTWLHVNEVAHAALDKLQDEQGY